MGKYWAWYKPWQKRKQSFSQPLGEKKAVRDLSATISKKDASGVTDSYWIGAAMNRQEDSIKEVRGLLLK